jgi:N4-gp56 family major capsid protein
MATITTYGDISPRTAAKAARMLLDRGQHLMLTERFGYFDPQPRRSSKTRKWRRYNSLANAVSPLAEGITPAGQKLTASDVTVNLEQYGDFVRITDVIQDTHEDPVLDEAVTVIGEQKAETVEMLRIAVLTAGSNVFYANGVATRALTTSKPTLGDFRKVTRFFRRHKGRTISSIVAPTGKIATEPVAPAFFAMGHTDLEADLRGVTGFNPFEKYSAQGSVIDGELGKIETVRVCLSALWEPWAAAGVAGTTYLANGDAPSTSTKADVYPLVVVARNAYAIVPLQGSRAVKIAVKNPGKVSDSDPMGQRGFVSWKAWQASAILNENWVARIECCATANPTS